ncbi:hypothetical protein [Streptomyces griseus]|uniref:hypothetical protein n=1 Tax=Streptomyces griseus TaxID=1911 RepID=UPI001F26035E|nr:hypothetical protein [Streptomyces griseus]
MNSEAAARSSGRAAYVRRAGPATPSGRRRFRGPPPDVVLELVDTEEAPLRLLLGAYPYLVVDVAYRQRLDTRNAWRPLAAKEGPPAPEAWGAASRWGHGRGVPPVALRISAVMKLASCEAR